MKYKKYILFQYHQYYPGGGLGDITDSFDTLEEARTKAVEKYYDYNEIVDRDTWEVVWERS